MKEDNKKPKIKKNMKTEWVQVKKNEKYLLLLREEESNKKTKLKEKYI